MNRARIAVLGGGLAGITAALECADAGAEVTLYESRPRLGGATFSIRRGGHWLDNGQHVALRCCTAYRRLLATLGTDRYLTLQPRLSILVLDGEGNRATFGRTAQSGYCGHTRSRRIGNRGIPNRDHLMIAVRGVKCT